MNKGPLRASEEEKFQIRNILKMLETLFDRKSDTNVTTTY